MASEQPNNQINRPNYFPKPGSENENALRSLIERATPEEVEAIGSLLTSSLHDAILSKRRHVGVSPRFYDGLQMAAHIPQEFGTYLVHLADAE